MMKNKEKNTKLLKGVLYILIPWLFLYIIELPLYRWYWFFGMHKWGLLAYVIPLFVYIPLSICGFFLGLITYPVYLVLLKNLKKKSGFGFANWSFVLNTGLVIFILITNKITLGLKSSTGIQNAAWLFILIGAILSFILTWGIFYPIANQAKDRVISPFKMRKLILIGVCLFILSITYTSSRVTSSTKNLKGNPNVLVITLDTANINYLPGYGSPDLVAPRMAEFIDESVLFSNAYASVPLTAPSHGSIFSGAHPQIHKAYTNESKLPYKVKTIAEYFKSKGYTTAGFPSSYYVTSQSNFDQGFDYFVNRQITDDDRTTIFSYIAPGRFIDLVFNREIKHVELPDNSNAKFTNTRFLRWVKKNKNRRWFAWVHYFDLHAPYLPPSMASTPRAQQMGDVETSLLSASVDSLTCLFGN
ncbi:MAG: sulfatase-like hydrolase/transferase, partial [bacterium]